MSKFEGDVRDRIDSRHKAKHGNGEFEVTAYSADCGVSLVTTISDHLSEKPAGANPKHYKSIYIREQRSKAGQPSL